MGQVIRVMLADDSSIVRRLMTQVISANPRCQLVYSAKNGQEAVDNFKSVAPDLVLLDVEMPVTQDGLEWRLEGAWPEASPAAAVSVTVEPDGLEGRTETRWSGGALLESFLVYVWTE